jgi:hypothetical protein
MRKVNFGSVSEVLVMVIWLHCFWAYGETETEERERERERERESERKGEGRKKKGKERKLGGVRGGGGDR